MNSDKIFYFCQVIGRFLVVVVEPPKTAEADEVEPEDSALSSHLDNLQLNDEPAGIVIVFCKLELLEKFIRHLFFNLDEVESPSSVANRPGGNKKICTFVTGKGEFCICKVCIKLCHKGHNVSLAGIGKSFCDCGSDDTEGVCKAINEALTLLLHHRPIKVLMSNLASIHISLRFFIHQH